jgi:hypothetical protein
VISNPLRRPRRENAGNAGWQPVGLYAIQVMCAVVVLQMFMEVGWKYHEITYA